MRGFVLGVLGILLAVAVRPPAIASPLDAPSHPAAVAVVPRMEQPGPASLADDGDRESLLAAIGRTRVYLATVTRKQLPLGERGTVPVDKLRIAAERFEALVRDQWGEPGFDAAVRAAFTWVPMAGRDGRGSVLMTGYHMPSMAARRVADEVYKFPIYGVPGDLVTIDLGLFRTALAGQSAVARVARGKAVPYYSRTEIDDGRTLVGKGYEIAWVADEQGRYDLMVQGSGLLQFDDGMTANVNYAGENGHAYIGMGFEGIPLAKRHARYNRNPSYVFFKLAPDGPFGCDGIPLTGGRAFASDKRLYGSGGIAYVNYPRPRYDDRGRYLGSVPSGRFMLDQDTGGAIRGTGHLDLYWGGGDEGARMAVGTNGPGRAYFMLPREPGAPIPTAKPTLEPLPRSESPEPSPDTPYVP